MNEKQVNAMTRLEWAIGDWKEKETDLVIMDDSDDSGSGGGDMIAASSNKALLTPLDSALASISHVFNGPLFSSSQSIISDCQPSRYLPPATFGPSDFPCSTFLSEECPSKAMPVNTPLK